MIELILFLLAFIGVPGLLVHLADMREERKARQSREQWAATKHAIARRYEARCYCSVCCDMDRKAAAIQLSH